MHHRRPTTGLSFKAPLAPLLIAALLMAAGVSTRAHAQAQEFRVTPDATLEEVGPDPDTVSEADPDRAVLDEARRLIAIGEPKEARKRLKRWINDNERSDTPLLPEALLLRAVADIDRGREFKALFDLELIARQFPASPEFEEAVRLEYEIGAAYLNGRFKRFLGTVRIEPAYDVGEELMIRVQERLPSSPLAERAATDLAEYYFRTRRLRLASEMYEIFSQNFPDSADARRARLRRIQANVALFKGPRYDGSSLVEADTLLTEYVALYPAEGLTGDVAEGIHRWIDESRAAQLLESGTWYFRRNEDRAGAYTLRRLIQQHPGTAAARSAIDLLEAEGWLEIVGDEDEASQDAAGDDGSVAP